MKDEGAALLIIGVCIFMFAALLLGIGSVYGGSWEVVAQGVIGFIVVITCFAFGCYVAVQLMERR